MSHTEEFSKPSSWNRAQKYRCGVQAYGVWRLLITFPECGSIKKLSVALWAPMNVGWERKYSWAQACKGPGHGQDMIIKAAWSVPPGRRWRLLYASRLTAWCRTYLSVRWKKKSSESGDQIESKTKMDEHMTLPCWGNVIKKKRIFPRSRKLLHKSCGEIKQFLSKYYTRSCQLRRQSAKRL